MSSKEDLAIERAMALLGEIDPDAQTLASEGGDPALDREYREVLGLLAFEAEPVAPSPGLRDRVLESARMHRPRVVLRGPGNVSGTRSSGGGSRLLLVAAVLLSVVLSGLCGWLFRSLLAEREVAATLRAALDARQETELALASTQEELARLKRHLILATSPGVEVCPLKPHGQKPEQPDASGLLYLAPNGGGWLLAVNGLAPCERGRQYHVWFLAEEGMILGEIFGVKEKGRIEIAADQVPNGTRAVMITLEDELRPSEPTGPTVLFGDEHQMLVL